MIGFDNGITIFTRMESSDAPSSFADSLSETGMVSKKPLQMRYPSPEPAE